MLRAAAPRDAAPIRRTGSLARSEYGTIIRRRHAGTSISRYEAIERSQRRVWAVVAIIGGGAQHAHGFEGQHIGHDKRRVIVVLNDTAEHRDNFGAARGCWALRTGAALPRREASRAGGARQFPRATAEEARRRILTLRRSSSRNLFEQLGFTYFGPVDGHDLFAVENVLTKARDFRDGPVLVHLHTQKGHGYGPAEDDNVKWHGVSAPVAAKPTAPQYTAVFADAVREILNADQHAVAVTAAMPGGTGLLPLVKEFPQRVIDVGICEQHAVTMAAGLATQGIVPIVAIYSTFLQRGFDQVLHDVAVQDLSVVFAMDRAGIVGDDGRTHQGLYDIAFLRPLPGIVLMAPKDEAELRDMMWTAHRHAAAGRGPIGVRFPRGTGAGVAMPAAPRELPIGVSETLREGDDLVIAAYGTPSPRRRGRRDHIPRGVHPRCVNARSRTARAGVTALAARTRVCHGESTSLLVVRVGVAELCHERARVRSRLGLPRQSTTGPEVWRVLRTRR